MSNAPRAAATGRIWDRAHPVDRHVGLQISLKRKTIGMSQERLAEAVGLSFQQIQKYERGSNRVSASMLWEIARALGTDVDSFFVGLGETPGPQEPPRVIGVAREFLLTPEGAELSEMFPRLSAPLRRRVLELVLTLVASES